MTREIVVNSVEETERIATKLAALLTPPDVLTLEGDLGAGKTTFTKALAKGSALHVRLIARHSQSSNSMKGIIPSIISMSIAWLAVMRILAGMNYFMEMRYLLSSGRI